MSYVSRRDLLKGLAAGAISYPMASALKASFLCQEALAEGGGDPKYLVVIDLRGGIDALGALPFSTQTAHGLAIANRRPLLPIGVTAGTADPISGMMFHQDWLPLVPLFNEGQLKIIHGIGNPRYPLGNPAPENLSHEFNQQVLATGDAYFSQQRGGWLSRALEVFNLDRNQAMGIGSKGGPVFYHPNASYRPNVVKDIAELSHGRLTDAFGGAQETERMLNAARLLRDAHRRQHPNSQITQSIVDSLESLDDLTLFFEAINGFALNGQYSATNLGGGLRGIAKMIGALDNTRRSRLFYTSYSAEWDTHSEQLTALPQHIGDLANNLAAFVHDMKTIGGPGSSLWDRTLIITISEFGRRVFQNSNHPVQVGTDHGTGGMSIALGGRVRGGPNEVVIDRDIITNTNWSSAYYLPVTVHFQNLIGQALDWCGWSRDLIFDPAQYTFENLRLTNGIN